MHTVSTEIACIPALVVWHVSITSHTSARTRSTGTAQLETRSPQIKYISTLQRTLLDGLSLHVASIYHTYACSHRGYGLHAIFPWLHSAGLLAIGQIHFFLSSPYVRSTSTGVVGLVLHLWISYPKCTRLYSCWCACEYHTQNLRGCTPADVHQCMWISYPLLLIAVCKTFVTSLVAGLINFQ
jgi:hypothetical protein